MADFAQFLSNKIAFPTIYKYWANYCAKNNTPRAVLDTKITRNNSIFCILSSFIYYENLFENIQNDTYNKVKISHYKFNNIQNC